jgi:hypothetical protein
VIRASRHKLPMAAAVAFRGSRWCRCEGPRLRLSDGLADLSKPDGSHFSSERRLVGASARSPGPPVERGALRTCEFRTTRWTGWSETGRARASRRRKPAPSTVLGDSAARASRFVVVGASDSLAVRADRCGAPFFVRYRMRITATACSRTVPSSSLAVRARPIRSSPSAPPRRRDARREG